MEKLTLLTQTEWRARKEAHATALGSLIANFRERRRRGESHPIHDFLFTYYTYSPGKLEKWHPGWGYALEYQSPEQIEEWRSCPQYLQREEFIAADLSRLKERDLKQLKFIKELSENIQGRESRFSCFGLHEWAMVYKTDDIRHQYPFRLSNEEIERAVERAPLCCSHFDAFRFFTKSASKLNVLSPTSEGRVDFEQGGCLHANMDLYKWAFKVSPWISSELLRECFFLALEARELDMRASPYDFRPLGFEPIKIELEEGREQYRREQMQLAEKSGVLRQKLITTIDSILVAHESAH